MATNKTSKILSSILLPICIVQYVQSLSIHGNAELMNTIILAKEASTDFEIECDK